MQTAAALMAQARQDAKVPGFVDQSLLKLNIILDEICMTEDFSSARGVYYFPLNPANITTLGGITNFGGPYPLPLDYLRTSGSSGSDGVQYSFFFVYNGMPYPLTPKDLGWGDMQFQQPGIQNLPYAYFTDISPESTAQDRVAAVTTANTTFGSATITNLGALTGIAAGMACSGLGIAPGSTVVSISMPATIVLSLPATGTFVNASVFFGTPPNAYVYPGPSGAFPTTLRYQRLMPPVVDTSRVPWFQDQDYLLKKLTAALMDTSDDTRAQQMHVSATKALGRYKVMADDKTNRAESVILDRNRFGGNIYDRLPHTKHQGW